MDFIEQERYKNLFGIYQIRNVIDGNLYIGQTGERFVRRYWLHKWQLTNNVHENAHLQNAFNKYSDSSFVFEVVEVVKDKSQLDEKEIYHISNADKKYNILSGGGGRRGYKMAESTKHLIGESNRKNMTGKTMTDETKAKMSASRIGQYYTSHKGTNTIDDNTAFQAKHLLVKGVSAVDVSKELNIPYRTVNNMISNNSYKHVFVDGWDEYFTRRKRLSRMTYEDAEMIRKKYNSGISKLTLSEEYDKTISCINMILRNKTFNKPLA